eukprot:g3282.t2
MQFTDSIRKCINHEDEDIESWTAHFCLVVSAFVIAMMLNVRFMYLYRFLSCFTCSEDETLKNTPGLIQIYNKAHGIDPTNIAGTQDHRRDPSGPLHVFRPPVMQRFNTFKFVEETGRGIKTLVMMKTRLARAPAFRKLGSMAAEISQRSIIRRVRNSTVACKVHRAKCYLSTRVSEAYHQVAEVENAFSYSSWMKSAALFTVLMLIYNCIKTTKVFFNLASSWDSYHNLALKFQDGLDSVSIRLEDLNQNLTRISESIGSSTEQESIAVTINSTLPQVLTEVHSLQGTLDAFEHGRGRAYDLAGAMLDIALLTTAKLVNITDLKGNAVVGAFFYVDSIIPIIKYTCMIGYPIGTLIGLYSLYQVLVQHKRMSMGLEQALNSRTSFSARGMLDHEDARLSLLGIEQKYQIGGAVYFFGILMSTAVVQMHIFGFLITLILAVVVNIENFDILLNIGGYLIFVYIIVLITNFFVTHVVGDKLLTKDGFQIRHPWCFFLYLFTFSMVHAVLGFLYALWRALLLLITTFWVLNRLDVSLFLAGKKLDNGHYSFMSMLLLTRVIRLMNVAQGYIQDPHDIERGQIQPRRVQSERNSDETNNEANKIMETEIEVDGNNESNVDPQNAEGNEPEFEASIEN